MLSLSWWGDLNDEYMSILPCHMSHITSLCCLLQDLCNLDWHTLISNQHIHSSYPLPAIIELINFTDINFRHIRNLLNGFNIQHWFFNGLGNHMVRTKPSYLIPHRLSVSLCYWCRSISWSHLTTRLGPVQLNEWEMHHLCIFSYQLAVLLRCVSSPGPGT